MWKKFSKVLLVVLAIVFMAVDYYPLVVSASMASVGLSVKASNQPETYLGYTLSAKSLNNYELNFTGSESKITIGSGTSTFNSKLTFSRWNEVNFSLNLPLASTGNLGTGTLANSRLSFSNTNYAISYQPTAPKEGFNDLGGLDFILTYKVKPTTSVLNFTYSNSGIEAYLQPPLTSEYKSGWSDEFQDNISVNETDVVNSKGDVLVHRPDYVVNSVAFYATGKAGDYTALGGKNYKTGKVGHLYRLKAVDALGKWTWADWNVSGNTISLVCPQTFLNTASYPVSLIPSGDTFGYSTTPTAGAAGNANYAYASGSSYLGAAGTGVSMTISCSNGSSSARHLKMAIYDTASPSNKIANSNTDVLTLAAYATKAWRTANFTIAPTLSAVQYYLAYDADNTSVLIYFDNAANGSLYKSLAYSAFPSATISWSVDDYSKYVFGIYCTYTPTASYSLTNSPSAKGLGGVNPSSTYYAKGSAPANPVVDNNCTYTITNDGGATENISIKTTNAGGGVGWTAVSGAPGSNQFNQTAYCTGDNPASGPVLTTSYQILHSNLAVNSTIMWDFKLNTGTFTDGTLKNWTITLQASSP